MSTTAVRAVLGQLPGLEVTRVLKSRRGASSLSVIPDEATDVHVTRVDPDRAELIKQMTPPQLVVEEDAALENGGPVSAARSEPARLAAWSTASNVEVRSIRIRVGGDGDKPLAGVGVSLAGDGFPQEARTDKRGEVTVPLVALAGRRARALFVSAPHGYWDRYVTDPELSDTDVNVVRLKALEETIGGFPDQYRHGWGERQMGLDRLPDALCGSGVKIAIVDSGVDTTHPLLRHIRHGVDLTNRSDPHGWGHDIIGHGSHAAGIIAARDESGKAMRGFAPEAEIHVLKLFPGGQCSNLLEALDYCLELDIDIVNLNLACPERSQAVEQKLEEAALQGIACIVAAGNCGGPVRYPASSPYALAVGAVGQLNEFPEDTYDATTVVRTLVAPDGTFSPSWTCSGPEIAMCAPGVAVLSTVPGGFGPQSGTAVAAAHVTGLAALLLAHHPAFQGPLRIRNPQRVAALFGMVRRMCVPYPFGPERAGAGLPRLHGVEHLLQPGGRHGSPANGQSWATTPWPTSPAYGIGGGTAGAFSGPPFAHPESAAVGTSPLDPAAIAPAYLQASLAAQVWPVQALLESLRRQYLGG